MRCCYLCKFYWRKSPDGGRYCRLIQADPLTEAEARSPDSLKRLNCYTGRVGAGRPHFTRVDFRLHGELAHLILYCCCPSLRDLYEADVFRVEQPGGDGSPVEFWIQNCMISHCPCCGSRLGLKEEIEGRAARMRAARKQKRSVQDENSVDVPQEASSGGDDPPSS
jgi:hypothetical protein